MGRRTQANFDPWALQTFEAVENEKQVRGVFLRLGEWL